MTEGLDRRNIKLGQQILARTNDTLTDVVQGLGNEVAVTGKTLSTAASSFADEVSNDWHSGQFAKTVGLTAAAGVGLEVATARSPLLFGAVALAGAGYLGYQAIKGVCGAGSLLYNGWGASTEQQRTDLSQQYGAPLGKDAAGLFEGGLGFGLGGFSGKLAVDNIPAVERLSFAVTRKVEFPVRALMPESAMFRLPGSMNLGPELVKPNGNINALGLSERLNQPYTGVEVGRSIDLTSGRATPALPGTKTLNFVGFPDRPGRVYFHIQPPLETARPSLYDVLGTADVGIVGTDSQAAFFGGQGTQFRANLARAGGDFQQAIALTEPKLNTLILDHASGQAHILQSTWEYAAPKPYWNDTAVIPVNYQAARNALTDINPRNGMDFLKSLYPSSSGSASGAAEMTVARAGST
jgi:hypothetical protein